MATQRPGCSTASCSDGAACAASEAVADGPELGAHELPTSCAAAAAAGVKAEMSLPTQSLTSPVGAPTAGDDAVSVSDAASVPEVAPATEEAVAPPPHAASAPDAASVSAEASVPEAAAAAAAAVETRSKLAADCPVSSAIGDVAPCGNEKTLLSQAAGIAGAGDSHGLATDASAAMADVPVVDHRCPPAAAAAAVAAPHQLTECSTSVPAVTDVGEVNDVKKDAEHPNSKTFDDQSVRERHAKKASLVAQEILTTEEEYGDNLKLLDKDFRSFILEPARSHRGHSVSPTANRLLHKMLRHLRELHSFSETLASELAGRIKNWATSPSLADIFVRIGPFLKLFTSYITDFEDSTAALDEAVRNCRGFAKRLKEFEATERCRHLQVRHFMLKPIQRIPQYELLLRDYQRWLLPDSPDVQNVRDALAIVSEAASHANEAMKHAGRLQALLNVQSMLVGDFRVIEPSRQLIKSGQIWKHSRKEIQERMLILFSDLLLIASPLAGGRYRKKYALALHGMKTSRRDLEEYQREFTILSKQKSFTLIARSTIECTEWCTAINKAIEEREAKLRTFSLPAAGERGSQAAVVSVAPVWVPDSRTSMCMICCAPFTAFRRRHHCRSCGKVVCGSCSSYRAPLEYAADEPMRVCSLCFDSLLNQRMGRLKSGPSEEENAKVKSQLLSSFRGPSSLAATLRATGSGSSSSKSVRRSLTFAGVRRAWHRPAVLREVVASESGVISGHLLTCTEKRPKWKRFWFVIKGGVLYKFAATEDTAALECTPLLGYEVTMPDQLPVLSTRPSAVFKLSKPDAHMIVSVLFQADSDEVALRWVTVMKEFTVVPAYVDSRSATKKVTPHSAEVEETAATATKEVTAHSPNVEETAATATKEVTPHSPDIEQAASS